MTYTKDNGTVKNCREPSCALTYAHSGPCRSYTAAPSERALVEEIRFLRERPKSEGQ